MGCLQSSEKIDFDTIEPLVLRSQGVFNGTTEHGRFQTMGNAEIALSEDCFYSQVTGIGCCGDHGLLRIPVLSVKDIRQQSYFNGRFRADYPHMVISYVVPGPKGQQEYQAGWQMTAIASNQWKTAIEQLRDRHPACERA